MADITHEQVVQARREYMAGAEQRAKDEAARLLAVAAEHRAEVERNMNACIELMLDRLLRIGASDATEDVHFTADLICTPDVVGHMIYRLQDAGFSIIPFESRLDPRVSGAGWEIDVSSNQTIFCKYRYKGLNIIVKNTWTSPLVTVKSE